MQMLKIKLSKKELVANIEFIEEALGVAGSDAYEYFQFGIDEKTISEITNLIEKRTEAKKS